MHIQKETRLPTKVTQKIYHLGAPPRPTNTGLREGLGPGALHKQIIISLFVGGGYPQIYHHLSSTAIIQNHLPNVEATSSKHAENSALQCQTIFQGHHVRHFLANHNTRGLCISCSCEPRHEDMKSEYDSNRIITCCNYILQLQNGLKKTKTENHKNQTYWVDPTQLAQPTRRNQNKPNQNIVTHHPETNRHSTWKWTGWNTLLVFPLGQKAPFSGAFAVSFRECIHLLSSHHPYPFLPIFPTLHGPY